MVAARRMGFAGNERQWFAGSLTRPTSRNGAYPHRAPYSSRPVLENLTGDRLARAYFGFAPGFDMLLGDVNDIAVVEAVAESVNIVKAAPSAIFPLDCVSKTLEHHRSVSFRACKPVPRCFKGNSG